MKGRWRFPALAGWAGQACQREPSQLWMQLGIFTMGTEWGAKWTVKAKSLNYNEGG